MFEIEEIKNINNLADTTRIFNNTWSSRYPRPGRIIIDNSSEFQYDFKHLYTFDIKQKRITVKISQVDAVLEHFQQVVLNMLRCKDLKKCNFK